MTWGVAKNKSMITGERREGGGKGRNDDAERIRDGPIGIWRGGVGRKWELSGEGGREGGWKKEGERGKMVRRKGGK